MKKYIIKNCPALRFKLFPLKENPICSKMPFEEYCKDITDCVLKRIVNNLKQLQIITFEHGIKGMYIAEAKVELKQVSEILELLEIEEVDDTN